MIANFEIEGLEELDYQSTWKIMEVNSVKKLILTDKLEIDIIELPKIKGRENEENELMDWLIFLDNPSSERVIRKMEENENLKQAVEKLDEISADEKMQRIAELRQKAIMDEKAIYSKGIKDGIKQRNRTTVRNNGEKDKEIEIAKKMLEKGMELKTIVEITGLTQEEVEQIS